MSQLDVLTYGFTFTSDQGLFGWSTITLMTLGNRRILVDTGPPSRRGLLVKAIESKGLTREDIDTVVLTHLHWDHCQNTDLFPNARVLVHPSELDYARNPNRGDMNSAWYIADMLYKMKAEPISEGDEIAEGVSVIETPGHTKGHISVMADVGGDKVLITGDAMPDGGTVKRGVPYNVFWDLDDATASVEKMVDTSDVFYPGHDRPFRLDGEEVSYLGGPTEVEVTATNEGGAASSLRYTVQAHRPPNIDLVQKP